jgi:hypothetical protein
VTDDPAEVLQIVCSARETNPPLMTRDGARATPPVVGEQPSTPEATPAAPKRPE